MRAHINNIYSMCVCRSHEVVFCYSYVYVISWLTMHLLFINYIILSTILTLSFTFCCWPTYTHARMYIQEINYDSPRGGVSVITEKGEVTTSYLLIQKAKLTDSGLYTCMPTHANPNTVNVHVLNGMYNIIHYHILSIKK